MKEKTPTESLPKMKRAFPSRSWWLQTNFGTDWALPATIQESLRAQEVGVKPTEHQIQKAVFNWVSLQRANDWRFNLYFAVPNGGLRHRTTASKLKLEGVRSGVPDTLFCIQSEIKGIKYIGLAIEFKRPGGIVSENQEQYLRWLAEAGWAVAVVRSPIQAIDLLTFYANRSQS